MNSWDNQGAQQSAIGLNSMMGPILVPSSYVVQDNNPINVPSSAVIGPLLAEDSADVVEVLDAPIGGAEVQTVEAESSTHGQSWYSRDCDRRGSSRDKRDRDRGIYKVLFIKYNKILYLTF